MSLEVGAGSTWRERIEAELSTREMKFLMGVFARTSAYFFAIGLIIFGLHSLMVEASKTRGVGMLVYAPLGFFALCMFLPNLFMGRRYHRSPLGVSKGYVNVLYAFNIALFVSVFVFLLGPFELIHMKDVSGMAARVSTLVLITAVFGTAWLVYLVPVFVGWFVINRQQAIKLSSFLFKCGVAYGCLILVFLVSFFFSLGGFLFNGIILFAASMLGMILVCVSPVVTLFRFKVTAAAIDYEDQWEKDRWASYFGYVMLDQMLAIALQLMS